MNVPPRPDSMTGEPAPPAAPIWHADKAAPDEFDHDLPASPAGYGPALYGYKPRRSGHIGGSLFCGFMVMVLFSFSHGSVGWIADISRYWYVLALAPFVALMVWIGARNQSVYAGADWLMSNGQWVDLYDLKMIGISSHGYGGKSLTLKDNERRRVVADLGVLCANRPLWDLVYNGIVHAAADGVRPKGMMAERVLKIHVPRTYD